MVRLFTDINVRQAIIDGLRRRGIDILTAREDGLDSRPDEHILLRATELNRVLYSEDYDFTEIATRYQEQGIHFTGALIGHQRRLPIGKCIEELCIVAEVGQPEDFANLQQYLPL
jgi:hypothetical protein